MRILRKLDNDRIFFHVRSANQLKITTVALCQKWSEAPDIEHVMVFVD